MNQAILNTDIQQFIEDNIDSDITAILLKGISFDDVSTQDLVEQIEAKKRCRLKLPTWFKTQGIYYPNKLNIEQTSSEITAQYKASLLSGETLVDLTGGFGVDSYFFAQQFRQVWHCEINTTISGMVAHNYKQLAVNNIKTVAIDGIEFLKQSKRIFDWVYADPSRRHDSKGKVFFLADCLPNIPEALSDIFKFTNHLMIKTSPLLDLTIGIKELKYVTSIHVVAINNEVKELLWVLEPNKNKALTVKTVNITHGHIEHFEFILEQEKSLESTYSEPLSYLYEPNSAIMKAGAFHSIADRFPVFKLQKHSHLYTSDEWVDFPGRRFKILQVIPYSKKAIKQLSLKKANITTRNFPETVQQIRKKLAIKDGGDDYLFFTTNLAMEKIIVVTSKIK